MIKKFFGLSASHSVSDDILSDTPTPFRNRLSTIFSIGEVFDLPIGENEDIQIDLVFLNSDIRNNFLLFLRNMYAEELLLFLEAYNEFKKASNEQKIELGTNLYNNFIRNGSKYEINAQGATKKPIFDAMESEHVNNSLIHATLFDEVYLEVYQLLHAEFPRYLLSDIFLDFAKQKNRFDLLIPSLDYESSSFNIRHVLEVKYLFDAILEYARVRNQEQDFILWDMIQSFKKEPDMQSRREIGLSISKKLRDAFYPSDVRQVISTRLLDEYLDSQIFAEVEEILCDTFTRVYASWSQTSDFEEQIRVFIK
jgi:hypothetical protein